MSQCIRCGKEASGNFCSHCGQKQNVPRLSWKTLLSDFASRIYGLDGAFPKTLIGLFKSPQKVIQEYIDGVRNKYVGPVGYYFLLYAVYIFIFKILGINMGDYFTPTSVFEYSEFDFREATADQREAINQMMETISSVLQFITILQFPFWAWSAKLIFKKKKYNFLEHLVFMFYVTGQYLLISIVSLIQFKITDINLVSIEQAALTIYASLVASIFYEGKLSFMGVAKSALVYCLSVVAYFTLAILIGSIYIILFNS